MNRCLLQPRGDYIIKVVLKAEIYIIMISIAANAIGRTCILVIMYERPSKRTLMFVSVLNVITWCHTDRYFLVSKSLTISLLLDQPDYASTPQWPSTIRVNQAYQNSTEAVLSKYLDIYTCANLCSRTTINDRHISRVLMTKKTYKRIYQRGK